MARNPFSRFGDRTPVLVIGLGRFGLATARSLVRQGRDVLGVDSSEALVQKHADELSHVVQADATDDEALAQLGVAGVVHAVVAIGSDIEASVLSTMALIRHGVTDIWAKSDSREHGQILERIGAHHVIYPEWSMGEQVAHMIVGGMSQYLEFEDDFAIARVMAPRQAWNKTFDESGVRTKYGVTVVGVKRRGQDFVYAKPETFVEPNDELVVSGPTKNVEKFCALSQVT